MMVVDADYLKSAGGIELMASLQNDKVLGIEYATGPMTESRGRFQQPAPPIADSWISVWVTGNVSGPDEDRLVTEYALMGTKNFDAAVYQSTTPPGQACLETRVRSVR